MSRLWTPERSIARVAPVVVPRRLPLDLPWEPPWWERMHPGWKPPQASYALVGTAGALAVGSGPNVAITPAYGQSPTAGNLLCLGVLGFGTTTTPTTPGGWTLGPHLGAGGSATIFYKIAAGGDTAPTIAALASTTWLGAVAEFSGNASTSPLDQQGTKHGSSGTQTAVNGAADVQAGELFFYAVRFVTSSAANRTITNTLNNGMTNNDVSTNGTSTTRHVSVGFGITTGNSAADQDAASLSSTYNNMTMAVASFLLASGTVLTAKLEPKGIIRAW